MQPPKTKTEPWRVLDLGRDMRLSIFDETNRYFGDYHRVCLRTHLLCPLAVAEGPDEVALERSLERMAVPTERVEQVREVLLERYLEQLARYLGVDGFAERLWNRQRTLKNRVPGRLP